VAAIALGAVTLLGCTCPAEGGPEERAAPAPVAALPTPDLTFSNTAQWDPKLLALANHSDAGVAFERQISLAAPPPAGSETIRRELEALAAAKELRTPERVAEIRSEIDGRDVRFLGVPFRDLARGDGAYPATATFLNLHFPAFSITVLRLKKRFDRVRPHRLRPDLNPVIEVPGHPAYPSGHASQAHFLGLMLADVRPARREALLRGAARVAYNREIAGVHYASDSAAGRDLAAQYHRLIAQRPDYLRAREAARAEWPADQGAP